MKLIIKDNAGPVSPEMHASITAAIEAELAASKYTFDDAMLAWIEYMDMMEVLERKQDLNQDDPEMDDRHRYELTDADRVFLATPERELVTLQPDHDERKALWDRLNDAAREAAGEMVWFHPDEPYQGFMVPLETR